MKKINIHKTIQKLIIFCLIACFCFSIDTFATTPIVTPTTIVINTITPTPIPTTTVHTHSPNCYAGTKHIHNNSCYIDANIGGCGGTLTWKETGKDSGVCPYCDGTYTCTYYEGTCNSCSKVYTDTIYDPCATCGVTIKPIQNGISYPRYQSKTCTYKLSTTPLLVLSCGKEENKYYLENGTLDSPICSRVAVSIKATKETQSGNNVDTTLQVTYLDGHVGVVTGKSNFDVSKDYDSDTVVISYEGLIENAKTNGVLSTNIKMTTPPRATTIPSNTDTIVITKTPIENTNQNPNTNNNSNNQTPINKFSSNKKTRGNVVSEEKSNTEQEISKTNEIIEEERQAVSIKIKRPLTTKEKQQKIDGSMSLTKLYRNEENDLVGKVIKKDTSEQEIIETGSVNKGQVTPQKEDFIVIFIFFVIIGIIVTLVGLFFFLKKKKEEQHDVKHINLKNSLGL